MRRRLRRGLVVGVVLLAGCAGIPHGGPVHVGRAIPAPGGLGDIDVRVLPAAAQPSMAPAEIVHGFLRALVNADGDYEIARTFLTHRAAAGWDAGEGVTTYDDSGVHIHTTTSTGTTARTLQFTAPQVGAIDGRGNFAPRTGEARASFGLVRQSGQWRIDRLPGGVMLSTLDAQRAFRPALVFYLNRAGTTLVPEQVLLRPTPGVRTALVRALLGGPGPWLAPSVRTGFPSGTELLGNVPVDPTGVAEVNLSGVVHQASPSQLKALSAQLVWTLRQVSEISVVRLLADGSPLAVPGVPVNQPVSSWRSFNPAAPPVPSVGAFSHGGAWQTVGGDLPGLPDSAAGLTGLAISRDAAMLAGLRARRHGVALVVGRRGDIPAVRLSAQTLTAPTFDPSGTVFVVATTGATRTVDAVPTDEPVQHVVADRALLAHPVQQLRLSRDGARVAAVVGRAGHGRLLIGRVTVKNDTIRFEAFRAALPGATDIRGVGWDGGDQVVVTAANASGGRELVEVDVDGYGTRTVPTSGLPGPPVDLAATPGRPLLVAAGFSVWRNNATGGWSRVGIGAEPVYPD
ncbi:MAG TPA: LpqB family beta-propeller domain-containing protein [Mycobacteriales bacterium]|nr:LpqB family beta-propeller domain-containing protein [Mycobacteriales bacterium]